MSMDPIMADALKAAQVATDAYQRGIDAGRRFEREKFEAVIFAYDRALKDGSLNIPSYLHITIEHARSELAKQNIAAEIGIQRDRRDRHEGRPEHDLTTRGARLEAGS